jgi:hypothetical protein
MASAPVIDVSSSAALALTQMLEAGRVVGRGSDGRTIVEVAVDDWILDWFGRPRRRQAGPRPRS